MTINFSNSSFAAANSSQGLYSSAKVTGANIKSTDETEKSREQSKTQGAANTSASSSSSSSSELSKEEQVYDTDGDGVLSATEQAAMLEAQAKEKEAEALKNTRITQSEAASLEISQEGYSLYMQYAGQRVS